MIVSSSALASTITAAADKLKVELPAGFIAAVSAARELPRAAEALAGNLNALHAAALDALAAGQDPTTDEDVARFAIARVLADSGLRQAAEQRAGSDLRTAIAEYSDSIIGVWAEAIGEDCQVLHTAAAELGHVTDLGAADHTALRLRGQLNLWADAAAAADRAEQAMTGIDAVLSALSIDNNKAHRPLRLAPDLTLEQFDALPPRASAWAVARTGSPLRLASIGDCTAAIGRLTAERQQRQRQAEAEQLAAQRAYRPIPPRQRIG